MNVTHPNYGQNYQLTRAALRLGTFTASELEDLTGAARNTVYGFVSKLRQAGEGMLTAEELQSLRGRPQKRYCLTDEGTKYLSGLSFELASRFGEGNSAQQQSSEEAGERILLPSDIYEEDEELLVQVEVPGLSRNDVDVRIEEDELVVSGERPTFHARRSATPYITERQHGRFKRVFPLPRAGAARIRTVDVKNGILEVVVEKTAPAVLVREGRIEEGITEGRTREAAAAAGHPSFKELA